jgi:hypothetical protein
VERKKVMQECWDAINGMIQPGTLQGNGCDQTATRNGIVLAANKIFEMTQTEGRGLKEDRTKELIEALEQCVAVMPVNDPMYRGQLETAWQRARYLASKCREEVYEATTA